MTKRFYASLIGGGVATAAFAVGLVAISLAGCSNNAAVPANLAALTTDALPCGLAVQAAVTAASTAEAKAVAAAGVFASNSACTALTSGAIAAINAAVQ